MDILEIKKNAPDKLMPFQKFSYCRRCSSYKDNQYFNGRDWCISCQNTPVGEIAKK